jgi:hypothetical protein
MRQNVVTASARVTRSVSRKAAEVDGDLGDVEVRAEDLLEVQSLSTDAAPRANGLDFTQRCSDPRSLAAYKEMLQLARTDLAQKTRELKRVDSTVVQDIRGGRSFDPNLGRDLLGQVKRIPKTRADFETMAKFANNGVTGAYWRCPRPTAEELESSGLSLDEALTLCGQRG